MELYLGSIIEPIRKSIRNTLYFNSKHAPKTLGEAMQKAQDLHIKHLYAIGEDQESVTSSSDVLPEITINEVISREDRGWYKNKRDFREHSQNSREISPQRREYTKRVTFNQSSGMKTANDSEYSDSSRNLRVPNHHSKESENDKSTQQPSVICGFFTQIIIIIIIIYFSLWFTSSMIFVIILMHRFYNGESNAVTGPRVHSMVG